MYQKLKESQKGVVFVTVLMIIIVMMILTVTIMSLNVSQVTSTEGEIRRIQAQILVQGIMANQYGASGGPQNITTPIQVKLGNVTYDITTQMADGSFNVLTTFSTP